MAADPITARLAPRLDGRRFAVGLTSIAGIGLGVRLVYLLTVGRHVTLGYDAVWYEFQAGTIAHGHGYVDPDAFYRLGQVVPTANFPPLWPLLLAAANRIGLSTETGYQLIGAFVGTCTVVLTGLLGRRVVSPRIGLIAAAIVAVSPMLIAADASLMSESLYVALVTAALLATYRAIERPTLARFAIIGVLVGLAVLTRSDGIILAPLLAGAAAWRASRSPGGPTAGRRIALALGSVLVAVLVVIPWTVYSSSRLGQVVVLSNNSGNVLEGANCATTYGGRLLGGWDAACVSQTRREGEPEVEWSAAARRTGIEYAKDHPARVPLVGAARVLRTWGAWNPVAQTRLEVIESRSENWQLVGWAFDVVLLGLAIGGALLLWRRVTLVPIGAVVLAVSLAGAVANGNQRFRLAALPALAVLAAVTLVAMVEHLRSRA